MTAAVAPDADAVPLVSLDRNGAALRAGLFAAAAEDGDDPAAVQVVFDDAAGAGRVEFIEIDPDFNLMVSDCFWRADGAIGYRGEDWVRFNFCLDATASFDFADRGRYMADSDFVSMPKGLLNKQYLRERSTLLRRDTALPAEDVTPGEPPWDKAERRESGIDLPVPSTSHFVIVDAQGNIVSMTSSIENGFGARLMAAGFLLNNQLTDFSFLPETGSGETVANRVEPGKRPRSSMSPTIILKDGKPAYAIGSPGGSRIIPYVAKTIIALIDWRMNIQQAVAMPHLTNRFGTYDLEAGTAAEGLADDLTALGFDVAVRDLNSGLHGIAFTADGLEGGADPRREGVALAD